MPINVEERMSFCNAIILDGELGRGLAPIFRKSDACFVSY